MRDVFRSLPRQLTTNAKDAVRRFVDGKITQLTGLNPIDETLPEDIFVCGYPKSGNTWFQHLIAGLVFGVDVQNAPDGVINDVVPDTHFRRYYRRYLTPSIFKTHHLPRPSYRRIVYLIRDGRDAMVSYFHHLAANSDGVDFARMVETGQGLYPGKWHEHVRAYLETPNADLIVIRYEDLVRDTAKELGRFCSFARIERSESMIRWAVERASFDNMRRKEVQTGWETPGWPKDKLFVRRGKVGSYRDEMPPDIVEVFMRDARDTMIAHGYAADQPAGPTR